MIAIYQLQQQTGWNICNSAYDGCPGAKHFGTFKRFCLLNGRACPVDELIEDIHEMFLGRNSEEEGQ